MNVTKIDIAQEQLAIKGDRATFYQISPLGEVVAPEDQVPFVHYTAKRYRVIVRRFNKVCDDGAIVKAQKNYLIPIDEEGLFSDLEDVSEYLLESLINDRTQRDRDEALARLGRETDRIRALPWWRRLFKRF